MRHGDDEERCEKRRNAAPSHCKQAAEKDDVVGELIGWNRTSRRDAEARVDFDLAIVSDEMRSAQPLIERQQPLGGESEESLSATHVISHLGGAFRELREAGY